MATVRSGVNELKPGVALVEDNEAEGGRPVWRSPAWRRSGASGGWVQEMVAATVADGRRGRWSRQCTSERAGEGV
jgi:hypothetical protein